MELPLPESGRSETCLTSADVPAPHGQSGSCYSASMKRNIRHIRSAHGGLALLVLSLEY